MRSTYLTASMGAMLGLLGCTTAHQPQPVQIVDFHAEPEQIELGGTATLHWTVRGTSLLQIDNGVGDVTAKATVTVTPQIITTYTLIATSPSGFRDTRSCRVMVYAQAEVAP